MANKKIMAAIAVGTFAIAGVAGAFLTAKNVVGLKASDEFSVVVDADAITNGKVTTENGYEIALALDGVTAGEGTFTMAAEGSVSVKINSVKAVAITSDDEAFKTLELSYGYAEGSWVRQNLEGWFVTSGEDSILTETPNYVKISATEETVVTSIKFTYVALNDDCSLGATKPTYYSDTTTWNVRSSVNSWSAGEFTYHSYNKNMDVVEYKATLDFIIGSEFKVIDGDNWDAYKELSVKGSAIDDGKIDVSTRADGKNSLSNVAAKVNFYLQIAIADSSVTLYIELGEAISNPVDLENDELIMDVYYDNSENEWATVYAYAWDDYGNKNADWPGVAMTLKEGETTVYQITYNTSYYTHLIFNNGTGEQTGNLTSPTDPTKNFYSLGNWIELGAVVELARLYFKAPSWWLSDNSYSSIYAWGGDYSNGWPGKHMTKVGTNNDLWYFDYIPGSLVNFIFVRTGSDNSDWGAKTIDLNVTAMGTNNFYDCSGCTDAVWGNPGITGTWSVYSA